MPIFYHYTDEEGAKNIIRSGTIQASLKHMTKGDTAHGNGVYLTSLNPWTSSKDEIMMNNWGNKNTTTSEKMKRVFILSIPKAYIKKAERTRRDIYLFGYGNDLRLHKYPWLLKCYISDKIIASYKYEVVSRECKLDPLALGPARHEDFIGDYVMSDEIVNGSPVYESSKSCLFMGSGGNWYLGPDVKRPKIRQDCDFSLGPNVTGQWKCRSSDGVRTVDSQLEIRACSLTMKPSVDRLVNQFNSYDNNNGGGNKRSGPPGHFRRPDPPTSRGAMFRSISLSRLSQPSSAASSSQSLPIPAPNLSQSSPNPVLLPSPSTSAPSASILKDSPVSSKKRKMHGRRGEEKSLPRKKLKLQPLQPPTPDVSTPSAKSPLSYDDPHVIPTRPNLNNAAASRSNSVEKSSAPSANRLYRKSSEENLHRATLTQNASRKAASTGSPARRTNSTKPERFSSSLSNSIRGHSHSPIRKSSAGSSRLRNQSPQSTEDKPVSSSSPSPRHSGPRDAVTVASLNKANNLHNSSNGTISNHKEKEAVGVEHISASNQNSTGGHLNSTPSHQNSTSSFLNSSSSHQNSTTSHQNSAPVLPNSPNSSPVIKPKDKSVIKSPPEIPPRNGNKLEHSDNAKRQFELNPVSSVNNIVTPTVSAAPSSTSKFGPSATTPSNKFSSVASTPANKFSSSTDMSKRTKKGNKVSVETPPVILNPGNLEETIPGPVQDSVAGGPGQHPATPPTEVHPAGKVQEESAAGPFLKGSKEYVYNKRTGMYECGSCEKKFKEKNSASSHMAVHQGRTTCKICQKICSRVSNLRTHMKICKKVPSEQCTNEYVYNKRTGMYECGSCEKKFKERGSASSHMAFHQGRTTCKICQKICSRVSNLRTHMKICKKVPSEQCTNELVLVTKEICTVASTNSGSSVSSGSTGKTFTKSKSFGSTGKSFTKSKSFGSKGKSFPKSISVGSNKDFPGQRRGMADSRSMDMGGMTNMLSHMGGPGGNFGGGMSGFGGNNFHAGLGGGRPGSFGGGMGPDFGNEFHDGPFGGMGRGPPGPEGPVAGNNGVVLLISNLPDQVANLEAIFNMVGMYGDCVFIKILRNKRDCCLVQLAKPHHAQQVKNFLDQAKVSGNKICISYSRADNLNHRRVTEGDELQADYSYSKFHRYRNHQMAARLQRNLGPPTATLHVANLPEDMTHNEVKELFIERGFTVKDAVECGNGGMALLTMSSPDEALLALALMHNFCPEGYKTKNNNGLCVSFSANRGERRKNQE